MHQGRPMGAPGPAPSQSLLAADALRARRFRTGRTVFALMLREMATTYGRSPGGYLWAVLDPTLAVVVLSVLFSLAFPAPPLGDSFPLFYATAYLPFMLFNDVANKMATSINFSRPLLAYPAVTFLDTMLARFALHALTHGMVSVIVYFGITVIFGATAEFDFGAIGLGFAMGAALGFGIGALNCYLMTAFPAWERAWQIATRPLFLISGIFIPFESMPQIAQKILWWNPLLHIVGMTRTGFYEVYRGDYVSVVYVAVLAMLTMTFGLLLLFRHHRHLLEK